MMHDDLLKDLTAVLDKHDKHLGALFGHLLIKDGKRKYELADTIEVNTGGTWCKAHGLGTFVRAVG